MAGHSKWANIKRKKEKVDARRGKLFGRIAKEIISAVKQGGSDPKANNKLAIAIERAKEHNFPLENIERNIKRASDINQADYVEMTYELYGYGGVALVVEILSDNRNRTSSDIRIALNKKGGSLASPGSVLFQFDRKGVIIVSRSTVNMDELFEELIGRGVEEIKEEGEFIHLFTSAEEIQQVKLFLLSFGAIIEEARLEYIPQTLVECSEEEAKQNQELIDWLEGLEDVDAVFTNMAG